MKPKYLGMMAMASVLALGASGVALAETQSPGTESTPVSAGGVTPYIIPGVNQGGNRTCEEVAAAFDTAFLCGSARVDWDDKADPPAFDGVFADTTGNLNCDQNLISVITDGTYVSFGSTTGVGAAIVKGGDDANVYVYDPQDIADSGLASPPNASGKPAGLSNLTFCWNPRPPVPPEDEWCSPGYWRQPQHLDSWAAAGYSPDDLYSDVFGVYLEPNKKLCSSMTNNPTLLTVLQMPQCYGGEAFNAIGDLLSEAHPDVKFNGVRVEDSCPLD